MTTCARSGFDRRRSAQRRLALGVPFALAVFAATPVHGAAWLGAPDAIAPDHASPPPAAAEVAFAPRPGAALPRTASFRDDAGRPVRLGDWFDGGRPVLLTFAAYGCPDLCPTALEDVARRLRGVPAGAYELVVVGIDAREPPPLAAARKRALLARIARPDLEPYWHFLTGDTSQIASVAAAAGFRDAWDPAAGRWAHAIGLLVLTPRGDITRAFFGLGDPPAWLGTALLAARKSAIPPDASFEPFVLRCFHLATGDRNAPLVLRVVRAGGLLAAAALALLLVLLARRAPRRTGEVPQ